MTNTKQFAITAGGIFMVTFNLGYVFHDVLFGPWFHEMQPFSREHYIVPLIAAAFATYALIFAHLFPIYRAHYRSRSVWRVGVQFGLLMGVLFDALQGGIIEVATFPIPFEVFLLDSGYHVFVEGTLSGLIAAAVARKAESNQSAG